MKKLLFCVVLLSSVRFTVSAQNFRPIQNWNYVQPMQPMQPQLNYGWHSFSHQLGDVRMQIPQGYYYDGLQNINGNCFALYQTNGLWYQQPVQWQMQPNGLRTAIITLNVLGSTLLNIGNSLQWNRGINSYQYYNTPITPGYYPYGIPFRGRRW